MKLSNISDEKRSASPIASPRSGAGVAGALAQQDNTAIAHGEPGALTIHVPAEAGRGSALRPLTKASLQQTPPELVGGPLARFLDLPDREMLGAIHVRQCAAIDHSGTHDPVFGYYYRAKAQARAALAANPAMGRAAAFWNVDSITLQFNYLRREIKRRMRSCLLQEASLLQKAATAAPAGVTPGVNFVPRAARLMCNTGDPARAARLLKAELVTRPGDTWLLTLLARAQWASGEHDLAMATAHQACLAPGSGTAGEFIVHALIAKGDMTSALDAVKDKPFDSPLVQSIADYPQQSDAIDVLLNAAAAADDCKWAWRNAARVWAGAGEDEKTAHALRSFATKVDPETFIEELASPLYDGIRDGDCFRYLVRSLGLDAASLGKIEFLLPAGFESLPGAEPG